MKGEMGVGIFQTGRRKHEIGKEKDAKSEAR